MKQSMLKRKPFKIKKVSQLTQRKRLIKECDKLWSEVVRQRDSNKCRICSSTNKVLHAHHIFAKGECSNTRYNVNNGICTCWYCHKFRLHTNPEMYRDIVLQHLTDFDYGMLHNDAAVPYKKYTVEDLQAIKDNLIFLKGKP